MINDDQAAIAAALDFSAGIAMWRSSHAVKHNPDFTTTIRFAKPKMLPFTLAALLAVMNCVLLGCAIGSGILSI